MSGEVKLDIDDYNKLLQSSIVASDLENKLESKIKTLESKYAEHCLEMNKHCIQLITNFIKGITNKVVIVEGDVSKQIKSFSISTVENNMVLTIHN